MKFFSNKGKFNVYVGFLILAISTSVIGKLSSVYDKNIIFKLTPIDYPNDKIVFSQSHDSVMLRLRGNGFSLAKYYFNNPELKISVKKLKEIKNSFLWNQRDNFLDTKLDFNSSVDLLSINEDSIFFFFDQYITKKIAVKNNIYVNYQPGFESFKSPVIFPDSVVVNGPDELLSELKYLETDSISFEGINKDVISNINILNPDPENIILSENTIDYSLEVDQYTEEIVKVPVNILTKSDNLLFNYYPKELSIKYIISINDYVEVSPIDFRIECVYDSTDSENTLKAKIVKKPSFVKNIRLNTSQIQIIILE